MLVTDLREYLGQTVTVCGWVNTLRLQRKMQFVLVRDPTGMVQLTHKRGGEGDALESVIEDLTPQSAVRVIGRVLDNPLDVRMRPQARLVFDVQTTVEQAMREYVFSNGFTEMHTPKLMG
ncbi:MAG: OB-fold nucleic acid binding domain-containing protein, partial [Pseudonocardiaceae bacterium]